MFVLLAEIHHHVGERCRCQFVVVRLRRRAVSVDFTLMQLETCLQPHGQLGLAAAGTSGRKGMRERRGRDCVLLSHMIRDIQEDGQAGEARTDAVSYEHVTAA